MVARHVAERARSRHTPSNVTLSVAVGVHTGTAIETGFKHGATVVTAAVLIMISVFAGFVGSPDAMIKALGFGLANAVLFDAFIVRMTIVPATLASSASAPGPCPPGSTASSPTSTSTSTSTSKERTWPGRRRPRRPPRNSPSSSPPPTTTADTADTPPGRRHARGACCLPGRPAAWPDRRLRHSEP
ncbi:MMPL family transporter [Streptomyces sp. NBC_00984]|uniref:MMPL family transporter n=1 Tax=Streptomyces sp. NBC_00984 TaxID=2903700 RepID=UPI00386C77A2